LYDLRVPPLKPSPRMLRAVTDETVVRALMDIPRMTRAELSEHTGLSKPTVAESIRRLESSSLVADTGERTTGRGGVGTYYALADRVGTALAIGLASEAVVAELIDPFGALRSRVVEHVQRPASRTTVKRLLAKAVRVAAGGSGGDAVRVAVVSAADPVDRDTGRLVHLPDAPFLVGDLTPVDTLRPLVAGQVIVDNDVNWAARAERARRMASGGWSDRSRGARGVDDFVYLYLGEGLGCAVVSDGEVRRGHAGLAGEVAHVVTADADGCAVAFTQVFARLGLRHADSTAIDVDALLDRIGAADGAATVRVLAIAICGVLSAAVGYCDPGLVVLGGPWGTAAPIVDEVSRRFAASPRPVPVEPAELTEEPSLVGVRRTALERLRADIVARSAN
jgi:predicted NBD/HSP70 family sugar kinase